MSYVVVFITAGSAKEARKIQKALVDKKLAACVNVIDKVDSIFRWQGKVDKAQESLLIVKTRKSNFKKLVKFVKAIHSYDLPEIIAIPIVDGFKQYLDWICENT